MLVHPRNTMQLPPSPPLENHNAMSGGMAFYPVANNASGIPVISHSDSPEFASPTRKISPSVPRDMQGQLGFPPHSRQMSVSQHSDSSSPEYSYADLAQGYVPDAAARISMSSAESGQTTKTESSPPAVAATPLTIPGSPFADHSTLASRIPGEPHTVESILSMFPGTRDVLKSAAAKQEQEARKQAGAGKPKRVRKRRSNSGIDEVDGRRRVQNRLSQRSYRERKENTIKTLTADLKDACAKLADAYTETERLKVALYGTDAAHNETKSRLAALNDVLNGMSLSQHQILGPRPVTTMSAPMSAPMHTAATMATMTTMTAMPTDPSLSVSPEQSNATLPIRMDSNAFGISSQISPVNGHAHLPAASSMAARSSPMSSHTSLPLPLGSSDQMSHQLLTLSGNPMLTTPNLAHSGMGAYPQTTAPYLAPSAVDSHNFFSSFVPE